MVHKKIEMVSVIIPCYNGEAFVENAILTVKGQTYGDWDCVIVDDGSTDGSLKKIKRATKGDNRFQVFHTENRGVAAARNLAISHCKGEYVLPLDADDILLPTALERFAQAWKENPNASLVVPMIRKVGKGQPSIQDRKWNGYEELKTRCTPTNSSCFRKSDWERVGGYRDGTMYEDWEFWLRLLYHNDNVVNIPEVLVIYNVRRNSRYHQAVKRHEKEIEILKQLNPEIYGQ